MTSTLERPTPADLRLCYLAELSGGTSSGSSLLHGRWASEEEYVARLTQGVSDLRLVRAQETSREILGFVGLSQLNLSQQAGYLHHGAFRESMLFWRAADDYISQVCNLFPLRRMYVELRSSDFDLLRVVQAHHGVHHACLRDHRFHDGSFVDVDLWSIDFAPDSGQ